MHPSPLYLLLTICVALIFSWPKFVAAQQSALLGRVVDSKTNQPIAGATVTLAGLPGTVKTDAEGRFTWPNSPAPPIQIIVVLQGGHVARPVDIATYGPDGISVPVDALADESVTVIGAAPSISSAPASATTLLSSTQIARRTPENLMQALETVPGVNVLSEGHASVPAIRGLARGRTLVMIDGARVTSERRVGPSATFADPASFEGIDVARGPGSVAYGSDALGGVISVRTRRAEPDSPLQIRGSGTLGGGIPDRRATVAVSKGLPRGGILVQGHARDADDWDSPIDDESIFNSGWSDGGVNARFDHQLGSGLFSAGWQGDFGRDIERPRNNSRTVRFYYPYENSNRFTSSYEIADIVGLQELSLTGFVGTFEQRTDQDRFATTTTGRSIERADVSAKDFHVKAGGTRGLGAARVELGVDVNGRFGLEAIDTIIQYDLGGNETAHTDNLSVDSAHRTDVGAYVQADLPAASMLRLSGGLRGDLVTTQNVAGFFGDRHTSNGAFSGFASVTAGPFSNLTLTGQVSRGFRDPTISDRYFRGPSGRGFITGNPDLDPETSLQFDVAARYALSRTQVAAYFYHYRIDDLVERYSTETDFFFFRNRGRARVRGFEIEARTELGAGFGLEGGLNIGRGEALDDDADLDDIAPDSVFVVARKDFGKRAYGQLRASFLADDDRPGPSEVVAPGAQIVDVGGGWRFLPGLELRGMIRNLLDDAYFSSPDPRWVYAPGRSGSLTLAFEF
jgi:outer membrane receptor protein involved in Fe transport